MIIYTILFFSILFVAIFDKKSFLLNSEARSCVCGRQVVGLHQSRRVMKN